MIQENRTPQQAADHAGKVFDDAIAKGYSYVLLVGRKATFARERHLAEVEVARRKTTGASILPMRLPVSRIQFIAWVLQPKGGKAD